MRSIVAGLSRRLTDADQFALRARGTGPRILDVGCGTAKYPGAVGIDGSADTDADVVADLDEFPWPFDDDEFDEVLCQDVISCVADPVEFMAEVHRVARPGARVQVRTPHFSSLHGYDLTQRHRLSARAVHALGEPLIPYSTPARFTVVDVTIILWAPFRVLGLGRLVNRWQSWYERYFAYLIPAMSIHAEYAVTKDPPSR